MSLTDQAIQDMKDITGNGDDFGVSFQLMSPDGAIAVVKGFHVKIHQAIDEIGLTVNSKKASIAFSEGNLPIGYVIRITDTDHHMIGEVNLKGFRIDIADSTGVVKKYKAQQWFPDEKLGLIVVILGDYAAD